MLWYNRYWTTQPSLNTSLYLFNLLLLLGRLSHFRNKVDVELPVLKTTFKTKKRKIWCCSFNPNAVILWMYYAQERRLHQYKLQKTCKRCTRVGRYITIPIFIYFCHPVKEESQKFSCAVVEEHSPFADNFHC